MDFGKCIEILSIDPRCRAIVIIGSGNYFCGGFDFTDTELIFTPNQDIGRGGFKIHQTLRTYQKVLNSLEESPKPIIASINGDCIGGGLSLISACDIRHCSTEAKFSMKEVDLALSADLGTLQRLSRQTGNESLLRDLAFSGRSITSTEAKDFGLVSRILPNKQALLEESVKFAQELTKKSPVALASTKINLNFSRDNSISAGLQHAAVWNMGMIQSWDVQEAMRAAAERRAPRFPDLLG